MTARRPLIARWFVGLAATLALVSGAAAAAPRPGSLDTGFGGDGRLTDEIGCVPLSVAGVERADVGRGFVVVGSTQSSSPELAGESGRLILRGYDGRGRLDRDVGRGGTTLVSLPGGAAKAWGSARQRDGKLVVVGSVGDDFPDPKQDLFVARFEPDGSLDGEFGSGGVVTTDVGGLSEAAKDVVVQPDGRIVVAGFVRYRPSPSGDPATDLTVLRYRSDGTPDPGFGTGGTLRVRAASDGEYFVPEGVALSRDGAILVGGNSGITSRDSNAVSVARVRADGSLDTTVRFGGARWTELSAMSFDPRRGRIYLAGSMPRRSSSNQNVMYVAAVRANDLRRNTAFGAAGLARAGRARGSGGGRRPVQHVCSSPKVSLRDRALHGGREAGSPVRPSRPGTDPLPVPPGRRAGAARAPRPPPRRGRHRRRSVPLRRGAPRVRAGSRPPRGSLSAHGGVLQKPLHSSLIRGLVR